MICVSEKNTKQLVTIIKETKIIQDERMKWAKEGTTTTAAAAAPATASDIRWKKLSLSKSIFCDCVYLCRTHPLNFHVHEWITQSNGYYYFIYQFSILLLSFFTLRFFTRVYARTLDRAPISTTV